MPTKTRNSAKRSSKKKTSTAPKKDATVTANVAAIAEIPTPAEPSTEEINSHPHAPKYSAPRGVKRSASPATFEGFEMGSKKRKSFFSPYSSVYEKVIESVLKEARLSGSLKPGSTAAAIAKPISDALDGHFFVEFCKRHAAITQRAHAIEEENRELKERVEELEASLGAAMDENDKIREDFSHFAQEVSISTRATYGSSSDSDNDDSNDDE